MKRIWCILLALLMLTGCMQTASPALERGVPEPLETTPPTTEPTEPAPTEPPDAGISSVVIDAPETLTVTPEQPDGPLVVSFSNVDPQGAPEGGRLCTLTLARNGEPIYKTFDLALQDGASVSLRLPYVFSRYMAETEDVLELILQYGEECVRKEIPVVLENWPDEVYAELSGDAKPYSIDVLRNQNVVIVYGKDDAGEYTQVVHVFLCSTGGATPYGYYSLGWKVPWRALFGNVYGQYAIRLVDNILFHSVPYRQMSKDTLKAEEFNKLGTKASLGCIRMAVADVKWLYDYCPTGTSVHIYDVETLPVERPEQILIDPDDPRAGWDPTDPDEENPWLLGVGDGQEEQEQINEQP